MKNQAITDFEEVLLREPHNKAAQQELERLKSTSQNTDVKVKKTTPKDEIVTRKGKVVEIVEKHDHQRFSELSSETLKLTHPSLVTVETFSNLSSSSLSEPKHNIKIIKVNDNQHEKRVVENIIKQVNVKNTIPEAPTPIEVVQKSVCHVIPAVPKHYAQFNQEWNKLRDMDELKFSYLKVKNYSLSFLLPN